MNRLTKKKGVALMKNKIKDLRKNKGMTQKELALKAGVCRTTLSRLENNIERVTSTKVLLKIANALDTTVEQIFFSKGV